MPSRRLSLPARRVRVLGLLALAVGAATCNEANLVGPGLPGTASLSIAPQMQRAAALGGPTFTSIRKARGVLTPVGGGAAYTADADFIGDSATLSFDVTFAGPRQRYTLDIAAIDTAGDTLFRSLREVTAEPGINALVPDTLRYIAPDTAVRFILLTLSDTVLLGGDSIRVTAQGYGAQEQQVSPLRLGWISRDSSSVAVSARSTSSAALLAGNTEGDVWIVARAFNGTVDSILVPVHLKVGSVLLATDTLRMALGDATQLAATVLDMASAPLNNRDVTWTSLDPSVAVVQAVSQIPQAASQRGVAIATNRVNVIAAGVGTTRIVASTGGKSDTSVVVVSPAAVASVTISPDTLALLAGGKARFSVELRDARNNILTSRAIQWSSSDPLLAAVDADGIVTALAPGLVTVSAVSEGVTGTAIVRIDNVAANIVRTVVSPATVSLNAIGQATQLIARSYLADSSLAAGRYTWRVSTGAAGLLAVDSLGRLTALGAGSGYVIVTEAGGTTDSAQVVVVQVPALVVMEQPTTMDAVGLTATFHAVADDSLGTAIPGTLFNWTLDTPGVATMVVLGGDSIVVRGDANGTTGITASTAGLSGATRLSIVQKAAIIDVGPAALRLGIDGRALVTAAAYDRNRTPIATKPGDFKWSVEGSGGVVEIDLAGEVHGRSSGTAGVFAERDGMRSKTVSVDVNDANPLALMFSTDTLTMGDSARVSVFLSAARSLPVTVTLSDTTGHVKFSTDTLVVQPGLARQDVTLYALSPGATTITATDIGKLFAPATLGLTVGKLITAPNGAALQR